ncbi:sigma-70 family RNA polymerase sigma factor [cf. Phormidesmis sp. LEGE 11477]|uniref:sigma-70 family RNA polymerase sigma factor n=1 Tax=cf. Phormidesmis sp. LEGE 11477 TaxID=1828680 RepID=UPI00187FFC19|nr:sigma-70 family RNA polymerase sigma factor [cf. Phormidesmis sp. LEGE 11477]MBE9064412.1 sigma-70 family RNA polymerase sigma factor [cf. Phormidesmis sp. LEGE 11477]
MPGTNGLSAERLEQPHLDNHLRQLAIAAQKQPKGSPDRQRALTELISTLLKSRRLSRPHRGQFRILYEEIYAEALQRLFAFVCDRIDDYNLQKGEVLQWVNFLLSRRFFIEASRDYLPVVYKGMDARSVKRLSLEHLDQSNPTEVNPQLTPSLSQEVKACLIEDPEGLFKQAHVADHPAANFQYISIKRLEGYAWQDLSAEFGIPVPTLSSFYRRCLARFASKLKVYLS